MWACIGWKVSDCSTSCGVNNANGRSTQRPTLQRRLRHRGGRLSTNLKKVV